MVNRIKEIYNYIKESKMEVYLIYFHEYNETIPYLPSQEPLCDIIEEACGKEIYNLSNPGKGQDHTYKVEFKDKSVIHITITKE